MKLEELRSRLSELEIAIANTTQSIYMLQGHKAEVNFQISELLKQEEAEDLETPVEDTVQ